jgi:type II secretory pathway pseudopilin PulG
MPASSTTKWGLLVLAFLILLSSFSTVVVVGQQQQQQQQMQYTEAQLRAMTEQQLEEICIQRGFELLKDEVDPATGEVYQLSHDDYVEAAMRCLAIEQEMYV